jgi:hypothetical protein
LSSSKAAGTSADYVLVDDDVVRAGILAMEKERVGERHTQGG